MVQNLEDTVFAQSGEAVALDYFAKVALSGDEL